MPHIEAGLFLDGALQHPDGDADDNVRDDDALFPSLLDHLLAQLGEVGEARIEDHAGDGWIAVPEHEGGGGPHAPTPQSNGGHDVGRSQVRHDAGQILALVVTQTHVLAVGFAAAGKVKSKDGQSKRQQVGELRDDFDAGTGVAVHVDDDRDAVDDAFDGFPVRAFEVVPTFGPQGEVGPREALPAKVEGRWAQGFHLRRYRT